MRKLRKFNEPEKWTAVRHRYEPDLATDPIAELARARWRKVPEVKGILSEESGGKCIYCESKIGATTRGDVEHILPKSKFPLLAYEWGNLALACNECNRRKNDYFEEHAQPLNPYLDSVEERLMHIGATVHAAIGDPRAEITVQILEIGNEKRTDLIARKIDRLNHLDNLIRRLNSENDAIARLAIEFQLIRMTRLSAEYSAMIIATLPRYGAEQYSLTDGE